MDYDKLKISMISHMILDHKQCPLLNAYVTKQLMLS